MGMNMNQKRMKKSRIRIWVFGGFILAIAAGVVFLPTFRPDASGTSFASATVVKGSIAETVVGTGILENRIVDGDVTEVKIPGGIKIDKILTDMNEDVSAGDVLATIDPLSLQHRISSVRIEIADLDMKIQAGKDDDGEEIIRTGISGRVKKIFMEEGDSVSEIMNEHGMMMLISIDGKMAVDIQTSVGLSIGDNVKVVRENATEMTGEVSQLIPGGYTITLSDNGPESDEPVEVYDPDGNILGSGNLYIHQPIGIVASSGTVKTIHVSENESISINRRLVTLENVLPDPGYLQLLTDRNDLTEYLNTLLVLTETHAVVTTVTGSVTNIFITEATGITGDEHWKVAFTIQEKDSEEALFIIEVDELDILSIETGQEVSIIFNALPGYEFIGIIAEIASSSHSHSGVAKYAVEVFLDKDESMRFGMNATATIQISVKDDILTLPMEALQELSGNMFVFTERDAQSGILSGEQSIRTGISNGLTVEIITGLSEGDTVYYAVKNTNNDFGFGPGRGMGGGLGGGN